MVRLRMAVGAADGRSPSSWLCCRILVSPPIFSYYNERVQVLAVHHAQKPAVASLIVLAVTENFMLPVVPFWTVMLLANSQWAVMAYPAAWVVAATLGAERLFTGRALSAYWRPRPLPVALGAGQLARRALKRKARSQRDVEIGFLSC